MRGGNTEGYHGKLVHIFHRTRLDEFGGMADLGTEIRPRDQDQVEAFLGTREAEKNGASACDIACCLA